MFCPKCSQQQIAEDVRFCSRCGFLLTGVAQVVANNGAVPQAEEKRKRVRAKLRKKGVRQGMFMLLFSLLFSPILLTIVINLRLGPAVFMLTVFIMFAASILRLAYSALFEPDAETGDVAGEPFSQKAFGGNFSAGELPAAAGTNPLNDFMAPKNGAWRDSNELVFSSVTDVTTRQLEK